MADNTVQKNRANQTLGEMLTERGVSRRSFLKFASYTASIMALPATAATAIADGLAKARRQSVIWLSFQECTGCTESITTGLRAVDRRPDLRLHLAGLPPHPAERFRPCRRSGS